MAVFLRLFATVILACVTSSGVHAARSSQEPAATGAATGSITGQVTLKGKPAPGVTVVATPSDKDPAQMVRQMFEKQPAFKSSTDQDGNYRITGIPAGRYKVTVYSPTNVQDRSDDGGDGSTVTLSEGEELEDIDFDLEPGGVITGTITDASGRPLVREFVNINPVGDSEKDARQMIKTANMSMFYTDDRGIYRIYGLPAGRYLVSAGGSGSGVSATLPFSRRDTQRTYYPGVTDKSQARAVEVTAGAELSGIDIKIAAGARGNAALGRVIDAQSGNPIPNQIIFYNQILNHADIGAIQPGTAVTNAAGEFRLENLRPGSYRAGILYTGPSEHYGETIMFEMKNADLHGLEIKVHRGGTIEGIVTIEDAADPDALESLSRLTIAANVTQRERYGFSFGRGKINPDGSFRITGLGPGQVHITVADYLNQTPLRPLRIERDGVEQQGWITIGPGEYITGVRIVLAQAKGSIRGRVILQNGPLPPRKSLLVSANQQGRDVVQHEGMYAIVQPDGSFTLHRLVPGNYELEFKLISSRRDSSVEIERVLLRHAVTVGSTDPTDVTVTINLKE